MTKDPNKLHILDFIISVLARHEKALDRNSTRLESTTRKLEKIGERGSRPTQEVLRSSKRLGSKHGKKRKAEKKAVLRT